MFLTTLIDIGQYLTVQAGSSGAIQRELTVVTGFVSIFANTLIVLTFIFFVVQYYKVKKNCDISCNLKETLVKIISTLRIYQSGRSPGR